MSLNYLLKNVGLQLFSSLCLNTDNKSESMSFAQQACVKHSYLLLGLEVKCLYKLWLETDRKQNIKLVLKGMPVSSAEEKCVSSKMTVGHGII